MYRRNYLSKSATRRSSLQRSNDLHTKVFTNLDADDSKQHLQFPRVPLKAGRGTSRTNSASSTESKNELCSTEPQIAQAKEEDVASFQEILQNWKKREIVTTSGRKLGDLNSREGSCTSTSPSITLDSGKPTAAYGKTEEKERNNAVVIKLSTNQIPEKTKQCTKSPQVPLKGGKGTSRTNSVSNLQPVSKDKAIPLCLPNNFNWDPITGKLRKTGEKRNSLDPVPAAIQTLEGIKEPVCVVSIAGPCRDGKSYVLGEVFGGKNVFSIGHEMDPETYGVWMWVVPEVFQDSRGRDFRVILLDSEGINAVTAEGQNDHQIFTLTVLLASVLIYNSKGVPKRTDLNDLNFIVKLSQRIRIRSKGGPDDNDLFRNTFPFFLWLLRDVTNKLPPDCSDINQYFSTRVFRESAETTSEEKEQQKATESILQLFAGFEAFALSIPTEDDDVMQDISNSREKLNPKFLQGLKQFESLLKSKLAPKPSINKGEKVTGKALGALVTLYTDAINDPDAIPNVEAAWDTYVKKKCSEAKTRALDFYDKNMTQQLTSVFPCEGEEILKYHEFSQHKSMEIFEEETTEFISTCIDEELTELLECTGKRMNTWQTKNASSTRESCEKLLRRLKVTHLDPILKRVRNSRYGDGVSYGDIMNGWSTITREFQKKAIGAKDVRADVFFKFNEELEEEVSKHNEIILKMKDYDEDLAREKIATACQEQLKMKLQEDIIQMKKREEAWERKVTMLQKKQKEEIETIREQAKAEKRALNRNMKIMKEANMKIQSQFQAQVDAVAERERQANQALRDLRQQCDNERWKAVEQKQHFQEKMQTLVEKSRQDQAQMKQQLNTHAVTVRQNKDTIRNLQQQLANNRQELSSMRRQRESLQAQLNEANSPGIQGSGELYFEVLFYDPFEWE